MKKIALLLAFAAAGTVFSPVVIPTAQAAWYYCPTTGCVGHRSLQAVWDHAGNRDGLTAVQRDNLGLLEQQHRLGDEYNARAAAERAIVHGDVWGRGGYGGYGDDGPYYGGGSSRRGRRVRVQRTILAAMGGGLGGVVIGGAFGGAKGAKIGGVAGATVGGLLGFLSGGPETTHILLRNSFRSARVRVYEDSKLFRILEPGREIRVKVRVDSSIWAEAEMRDPRTNELVLVTLHPADGRGMAVLGDDAGFVFFNPYTRDRR